MQFLLICLSVIMILRHAKSSKENDIKDITLWCTKGRELDYYLTSGAGLSDKSVAVVTSVKDVNCSVKYKVKGNSHILLVVEFPDHKSGDRVCFINKNNSIVIRNYSTQEACQRNGTGSLYSVMSDGEVSVHFLNVDQTNSVKIIATSVRDALGRNCKNGEIKCIHDKKVICMTDKTLCDGHSNCGALEMFDEDKNKCVGHKLDVFLIFCTIVMIVLSFSLCISGAITLLPAPKEIFIQDFNDTKALFETEIGMVNAEIRFQTIYPDTDE